MAKQLFHNVTGQERQQALQWLSEQKETVAEPVGHVLENLITLCNQLENEHRKPAWLVKQLRRAMGIIPSSERHTSQDPVGPISQGDNRRPKDPLTQLQLKKERLDHLIKWHRKLAKKQKKAKQKIEEKMKHVKVHLTPEEEAECDAEHRQFLERVQCGDGADPALQSVSETLMTGAQAAIEEQREEIPADLSPYPNATVIKEMVEERERYDISFSVKRITLAVEKKVIKDPTHGRTVISGSTAQWGASGYGVTWSFLATIAILVAQYAMPMNRLAKLLSSADHTFTAGHLSRLLHYVARRFIPIYLQLVDMLADCDILMGDDTKVRVLEVLSHIKQGKPPDQAPWSSYRTREQAINSARQKQELSLGVMLGQELGFEFERRSGVGTKTSLNTTILAGRSQADDPRSMQVIYRSHLGGLGNLLETILEKRCRDHKEVTIVADLATVNLVTDTELCKLFNIHYAGCSSHARRTFALYEDDDPDDCGFILHQFKGLFLYEQMLDAYGRNVDNVMAVRQTDSRALWESIKELAQSMTQKWPRQTKLGDGARYILKNYKALTAYLDNPRLEMTNNFSERMLRTEKLIEDSSLFRQTLEGRFTLDILRSILQSGMAAQVSVKDYLIDVLKTPTAEIEAHPENFTPYAYAMKSNNRQ